MRLSNNVALVTCSVLLATLAPPALAQTTAAPDCATADKKMMALGKSLASMPASGDLDRDFAAMAAAQARMMMDAAKMEMACSKKPELRRMAEAILKQNRDVLHNLQITGGTTH